jgi:hypothetical protein
VCACLCVCVSSSASVLLGNAYMSICWLICSVVCFVGIIRNRLSRLCHGIPRIPSLGGEIEAGWQLS